MDEYSTAGNSTIYINGTGGFYTPLGTTFTYEKKQGISPKLYFKYVKKKFGLLQGIRMERRLNKLWKLAEEADKDGQIALSEECLSKIAKETRECEVYALGFKIFIEKEHLEKFRHKTKEVSISITSLKNFVHIIPKGSKEKISQAVKSKVFDEIVIVHYDVYGDAVKRTEKEEREDPIAFGKIKESDRFYFITDWEDEFCDLTLDDIVDKLKLKDENITLSKNPQL